MNLRIKYNTKMPFPEGEEIVSVPSGNACKNTKQRLPNN